MLVNKMQVYYLREERRERKGGKEGRREGSEERGKRVEI